MNSTSISYWILAHWTNPDSGGSVNPLYNFLQKCWEDGGSARVGECEDDLSRPALQSYQPAGCDHLPSLQAPLSLLSLLTKPLQSQPRITLEA